MISRPNSGRACDHRQNQPAAALRPPDELPLDDPLPDELPDDPPLDDPLPDEPLPDELPEDPEDELADDDFPESEPVLATAFFSPPLSLPPLSLPPLSEPPFSAAGLSEDPFAEPVPVAEALESVR